MFAAILFLAAVSPLNFSAPQTMAATVIKTTAGKSAVMSLASFYTFQKYQYVDDATTTNKYTKENSTWITAAGSPFSYLGITPTTTASGIVKVDLATGLWWSDRSASTMDDNFTLTPDNNTGVPVGGSAITFCATLAAANFGGHNDWRLPTQKQLMQAYIDGSNYILPSAGYNFWSSTEYYNNPAYAWFVSLATGDTPAPLRSRCTMFVVCAPKAIGYLVIWVLSDLPGVVYWVYVSNLLYKKLKQAQYKLLRDGSYFGDIPVCAGVGQCRVLRAMSR